MESAARFVPQRRSLAVLRRAAAGCRGCPLWQAATQTVFGEGPASARVMLIGEQPGDKEDLAGRPFVGPAGALLDEALARAGIDRAAVYLTNAVKHFKFEPRGKRRLHEKPSAREVAACRPWLEAEIAALRPRALVLLGATAAQSLLGRQFRVTKNRGELIPSAWAPLVIATLHPAAIVRMPRAELRREETERLVADLRKVAGSKA